MASGPLRIRAERWIGPGHAALIVAEIGQNHDGDLRQALDLVDAAAWAGADAVKVVKRDLDCELTQLAKMQPYDSPHAFGNTYGQHREKLELSHEDHRAIAERIREHGLIYCCTACDLPSIELMSRFDVDIFKVASRDLGNHPLLARLVRDGRPIFLSTGMSDWEEIEAAVSRLRVARAPFALLQCTSLYPTPVQHAELACIEGFRRRFDCLVGFSDHTPGILLAPVAVALGSSIIEKHITLDRRAKGSDHAASLEPEEMRQLVQHVREVESAIGTGTKSLIPQVLPMRAKLGRSLVTMQPLAAGTTIDASMLTLKSPGNGVAWSDRHLLIGRRLRHDLPADSTLRLEDLA